MFVTNAAGAMRHRIWVAVHTFLICMSIVSTTILFVTPTRDAAVVVLGLHAGRIAARLRLQVWAFYEIWRRQRHNVPPEQRNAAGRLGMSYITNRCGTKGSPVVAMLIHPLQRDCHALARRAGTRWHRSRSDWRYSGPIPLVGAPGANDDAVVV